MFPSGEQNFLLLLKIIETYAENPGNVALAK
jgi:hypothetical protein